MSFFGTVERENILLISPKFRFLFSNSLFSFKNKFWKYKIFQTLKTVLRTRIAICISCMRRND